MNQKIELTDNEIVIKPFQLEDAETHLANEDDEQIKWVSGGKSTIENVKSWILRNQESWENDGPVFNFAVWAKDQMVGMVEADTDYKKFEGSKDGDVNISYAIYKDARGKGYATKAVNLMIEFLKQKKVPRATLRISPENTSSLKIPSVCGFQSVGEIMTKEGKMLMFVKNLE